MPPKSLIVIGGGPGGYAAALDAAERKMTVTLIERSQIGGTCTNRGCIPSKFLLSQAKKAADALHLAQDGIQFRLEKIQPELLFQNKDAIVSTLRQRMAKAAESAHVEYLTGEARLLSAQEVEVTTPSGPVRRQADIILLATGTSPVVPKNFPTSPEILTSTSILSLNSIPSHLVVLGGGYIGCELACAFHGFGSKVTLIEKLPRLLAAQPEFETAGTVLQRSFEKRGMTVWTGTEIKNVTVLGDQRLKIECSNGETFEANALLLALGRSPNTENLGLDNAGLVLEKGRPKVNEFMQTSVPSIYAIGDLVSPLPLAHVATREGQIAVGHMHGEKDTITYSSVPRCIYTWPEAASVGLTEEQARQAGFKPRIDRYNLAGSAKAMVEQETEGMWLIVSDSETHKVLGGQIVGPNATELIHLIELSLRSDLKAEQITEAVFAHPTLAEGYQEALLRSLAPARSPGLRS